MAGADQIVADHGSLVGSIGVVMGPFQRFRDVTGIPGSLLEPGVTTEGGVTEEYLTRGRGKDFGNPFREMTDEEWMHGFARCIGVFLSGHGLAERDERGQPILDVANRVAGSLRADPLLTEGGHEPVLLVAPADRQQAVVPQSRAKVKNASSPITVRSACRAIGPRV